jgi:hypothetical protein
VVARREARVVLVHRGRREAEHARLVVRLVLHGARERVRRVAQHDALAARLEVDPDLVGPLTSAALRTSQA